MYYKVITDKKERTEIFKRMQDEELLSAAFSAEEEPTLKMWLDITDPQKCCLLGCYEDNDVLMGCATFTKFLGKSQCYKFDFTAFRQFFHSAVSQARGAFKWMFGNTDAKSIVGFCPVTNRHAWAIGNKCGFQYFGKLAGACFDARQGKYVDAVMLCVTPKTLKEDV